MRAKLQVESVDNNAVIMNVIKENDENKAKKLAAGSEKQFFSDTPSGRLHFHMNNPEIIKNIKVGDMFYADFTKVANPSEQQAVKQTEQDKGKV